jgi:hypothetical protein
LKQRTEKGIWGTKEIAHEMLLHLRYRCK